MQKNRKSFLKRLTAAIGVFALIVTSAPMGFKGDGTVKAAYELSENVKYLSDMNYISGKAKDNKLYKDRNSNNQTIQLVMKSTEDDKGNITSQEIKSFIKGMGAWATSELVYEIPTGFQYFESYIGVDARRQETYYNGGVTFRIYLTNDLNSWGEEKYNSGTVKGMSIAKSVKLDVSGFSYIILVADENGSSYYSSWYDDAVYADARFTRNGYQNENIVLSSEIKTVDAYNAEIEGFNAEVELSDNQRLTILKREYVKRIGYDILKSYYTLSRTYQNTVDWLISDINNLEYYLDVNLGSSENYAKSLTILADLYKAYGSDFTGANGDLYKRMAIALSCSHINGVSFWATGGATNGSDAVKRYEIYKDLYTNNRLKNSLFDTASIPEMRIIMGNQLSDDQIEWLNWFAATDKGKNSTPNYDSPNLSHGYYIWYNSHLNWNYNNPNYFESGEVKPEINSEYHLSEHNVNTNDSKLWAVMKEGAVCGGQSKTGANLRGVYGYPSFVIGQPGHASYFHETDDSTEGNKKWTIGNNIYGWWKSEYGGNMLGWTGSFNGIRWAGATGPDNKYYTGSYLVLEQAAVNDITNLRKSQNYIYMAEVTDDLNKKEALYEKAVSTLSVNVKGWLGLIDVYSKKNVSDEKFLELSGRIAEDFKYYPLPMSDLITLIRDNFIKDGGNILNINNTLVNKLTWAKEEMSDSETLQPDVTRTIASNLLNTNKVEMATFSLDGPNAGKIIFDEQYRKDAANTGFLYSFSGAQIGEDGQLHINWNKKTGGGIIELTKEELNSLNEENGIFVNIEGIHDSQSFSITLDRAGRPEGLAPNDDDDFVIGKTNTMQWSLDDGVTWTRFDEGTPDLTGNTTVWIRNGATGHTLAGKEHVELKFTASDEPLSKKYISVMNIKVEGSTNHNQATLAENVLDGNQNTYWSSKRNANADGYKRLVFTFDKPRFITEIEIYPRPNGADKPSVLEVGASQDKDCSVVATLETIDVSAHEGNGPIIISLEKPIYTRYLYIKEADREKDWACISMVKFYENREKDPNNEEDTSVEWEESTIVDIDEKNLFVDGVDIKTKDGVRYITSENFKGKTAIDITQGALGESLGEENAFNIIADEYLNIASLEIKDEGGAAIYDDALATGMVLEIYNPTKEIVEFSYIIVVPDDNDDIEFDSHVHIITNNWRSDEKSHWKGCDGCDERHYTEDHTPITIGQKDATTNEKGYTGDVYCITCNRLLVEGNDIEPLGQNHSHSISDNWTIDENYHWKDCSGCTQKFNLGAHTKVIKEKIDATLTQKGYTGDVYCSVCEKLIEMGREIDKLGGSGAGVYIPSGGSSSSGGSGSISSNVQISGDGSEAVNATVSNGKVTIGDISENVLSAVAGNNSNTGEKAISIDLSKINTSINSITVSVESVAAISRVIKDNANNKASLEISLKNEKLNLDGKAIDAIINQSKGKDIEISINTNENESILNEAQRETVKDINDVSYKNVEKAIDLKITSANQTISDFKGGSARIGISSFKPEAGKNPRNYHVYFLSKEGKATRMATWCEDDTIYFQTGHFSEYIVVHDTSLKNGKPVPVYRLYNPTNGDHLFTKSVREKEICQRASWIYEGIAFYTLPSSKKKVYRLFNKSTGEHFLTESEAEKNSCIKAGWELEGVSFFGEGSTPIYRLYNPGGKHMYTASVAEKDRLIKLGWKYEGLASVGN